MNFLIYFKLVLMSFIHINTEPINKFNWMPDFNS